MVFPYIFVAVGINLRPAFYAFLEIPCECREFKIFAIANIELITVVANPCNLSSLVGNLVNGNVYRHLSCLVGCLETYGARPVADLTVSYGCNLYVVCHASLKPSDSVRMLCNRLDDGLWRFS